MNYFQSTMLEAIPEQNFFRKQLNYEIAIRTESFLINLWLVGIGVHTEIYILTKFSYFIKRYLVTGIVGILSEKRNLLCNKFFESLYLIILV